MVLRARRRSPTGPTSRSTRTTGASRCSDLQFDSPSLSWSSKPIPPRCSGKLLREFTACCGREPSSGSVCRADLPRARLARTTPGLARRSPTAVSKWAGDAVFDPRYRRRPPAAQLASSCLVFKEETPRKPGQGRPWSLHPAGAAGGPVNSFIRRERSSAAWPRASSCVAGGGAGRGLFLRRSLAMSRSDLLLSSYGVRIVRSNPLELLRWARGFSNTPRAIRPVIV